MDSKSNECLWLVCTHGNNAIFVIPTILSKNSKRSELANNDQKNKMWIIRVWFWWWWWWEKERNQLKVVDDCKRVGCGSSKQHHRGPLLGKLPFARHVSNRVAERIAALKQQHAVCNVVNWTHSTVVSSGISAAPGALSRPTLEQLTTQPCWGPAGVQLQLTGQGVQLLPAAVCEPRLHGSKQHKATSRLDKK